MTSEIHSVRDGHILAYLNLVIAEIIEIAMHTYKSTLPNFVSAQAVAGHPQLSIRNLGHYYRRKPFADWFVDTRP